MRVVRSPVAHGQILDIAIDEAAQMPGIEAVWTGADITEIPPIDFRLVRVDGLDPYRQPILAAQTVRYVGEPLAVVFAEDPYLAEDAAELIFADIEELKPCTRAIERPGIFAPGLSTEAAVIEKSYGNLDKAFDRADHVIELELGIGRHTGVPLETRGGLAIYDAPKNLLEVYGAAKIPHLNRLALVKLLGLELENLHIYESHVGGGFGVRGELYPEDVLFCLAATRLHRPVKWIEDRKEHLIAANHSRDQEHKIRAAVDGRGFILAIECDFWVDQGAYVRTHAATVTDLTAALLPGPYLVPAYRARGHIRLTNKTPAGTYRAPGRYEGSFVRERLIDAIACKLGIDPVAVRRTNYIPANKMPFARGLNTLGTEVKYDSGDYAGHLDKTLEAIGYNALKAQIASRRAAGEMIGVGMGAFVEKSGLGPSDTARLLVDRFGNIEIVTGTASVGQGVETVLAQICADSLGTDLSSIRVTHGQTDRIEHGLGAFASRATVMTGSAVHMAAKALKTTLLGITSELVQLPPDALEFRNGVVQPAGTEAGPSVSLAEVARHYYGKYKGTTDGVLAAAGTFATEHMAYPYGTHVAVVCVDRETARVEVERYIVSYDIGAAVNPILIEGQLAGGAAQGIGGALFEQFVYDEFAQPLSSTFMGYLIPTAMEIPRIETIVTEDAPSPLNPLGVKGAGEGGITAAGAAIAAAVDDAIGRPGAITHLPITPDSLRKTIAGIGAS